MPALVAQPHVDRCNAQRPLGLSVLFLPSVDARHAIVAPSSVLEALGEHTVMEVFLIALAVIAATGVAFFQFVIEPRRKIYDL